MSKETMDRLKRHPTEWEKTFSNPVSAKGLTSGMRNKGLTNNNNITQFLNKEDIQVASNHTKRCSVSLITREMQI